MTSPLATADLAWLQAAADAYLPDTAYVVRQTTTTDNEGAVIPGGAATRIGPYPCRVEPWVGRKGGSEDVIAGQFDQAAMWRVFLPAGTDVTATDDIAVGARLFDVAVVAAPESWEVQRMVICVERLSG